MILFAYSRPDPQCATVRVRVGGGVHRVEFFASPSPDPSGFGEGRTYLGAVSTGLPSDGGVVSAQLPEIPAGTYVTATASTQAVTSEFSPAVAAVAPDPAWVAGRYAVNPAASPAGLALVAGKRALRPDEAPSFEHVTAAVRGVDGAVVEGLTVAQPPAVTRDDVIVRVGSVGGGPGPWARVTGLAPVVHVGTGPGGTDRLVFDVRTMATRDRWMEVTVLANERTGLARPEVFYFGNLVGESGDAGSPLRVTALDVAAVKRALGTRDPALLARFDFTGDGLVNALDVAAVKANLTRRLQAPVPPSPPASTLATPAARPEGAWESLLREEDVVA